MSVDQSIRDSRSSYDSRALDEAGVERDPFVQLRRWLDEAIAEPGIGEANAMTVATADAAGRPSARIVLLRGVDDRGLVFFTNYRSRKGEELAVNPAAALLFYWDPLERELRVEGSVERLSGEESDTYFAQRPVGHRVSAWASPQSQVVSGRGELEAAMEQRSREFGEHVPRPEFWGGFRVRPHLFEFWQGRRNRIHDRIRYRRSDALWSIDRLAP